MRLRDQPEDQSPASIAAARRVFGEPYERPDGDLVIPVLRIGGRRGDRVTPLGVFVVHNGKARWSPVLDFHWTAYFGELIGLVAATITTIAILRRPPWPDLSRRWWSMQR
jgi:hypothetical protein